jgi:enoyl-CoA hydratase/carnithine racemase
MEKVTYRKMGPICWIIINRPDVHNAIDYDVMDQLLSHFTKAENDNDVKAVILTGAGEKTFCSGGDLQKFHSLHTKEEALVMLSKMGNVLYRIATFPKITVAFLNGTAVGGGCELATSCDYRLALPGNKFGFIQGSLGITTGWGGATLLMERIHPNLALPLLHSCERKKTEEGLDIGFINYLLHKDNHIEEQIEAWIKPLINPSLAVLQSYKSYYVDRLNAMNIKVRMDREIEQCATLWQEQEHHDAVNSFLRK